MENKLLKELYDHFYTLPKHLAEQKEVDECHQALIKVLKKPERRLVLRIIDAQNQITEVISKDSFITGFQLAWKLSAELNRYENEHPITCQTSNVMSAHFISEKEYET
ncbi:MAG: hypothetical protein HFG45_06705 [Oscillospiraceae bacterium]|nr:hypothetical protein [Oscillospiraceae bacterium]